MSVDHLQINVVDAVYNSLTWLPESVSGAGNDIVDALDDFNSALENVTGLTKTGARISSVDTSGVDNMQWEAQDPEYSGSFYISSSDATTLRNDVITQLATISSLNTYKDVAVRSYRNDLQASDGYAYGTGSADEGLEAFITGVTFKTVYYQSDSDMTLLLSRVNDALDSISGFEFAGIVGSSSRGSSDHLFLGIDDATYNGNKYLSLANTTTLRNAIISAMATVTDLDDTNIEVEVRISKKDNQSSD